MKKALLTLCILQLSACTQVQSLNPENQRTTSSSSGSLTSFSASRANVVTSNELKYHNMDKLGLEIALPLTGSLIEGQNGWQYSVPEFSDNKNLPMIRENAKKMNAILPKGEGYIVRSHPDDSYDDSRFFFTVRSIKSLGFTSVETFLMSLCENRSAEFDGKNMFSLRESWEQEDLKITRITTNGCPHYLNGAVIEKDLELYVISLPDGDWGKNAQAYYEKTLKSIRPIK